MTRLLCTADLHIGAGADHRRDHLADTELTLAMILDVAREHDVDGVLLAGDIFHRPKPTPAELHVFSRFTRMLERIGVPAVAVLGNAGHDQLGADQPTALELFASDWLRVSRRPGLVKAAGDVAVCTLPSTPVHRLVAALDGGDRGEANELAAALLVETAAGLRAEVPDGWPAVLVGHWAVSGASLPNGLPVADLAEPVLPLEALQDQGWDAVVLGHIHRPQILSGNSVFYCGSPMTHDFGEASHDHGVWVLHSVDHGQAADPWAAEFVPLQGRRFVTVTVDLEAEALDAGNSSLDETDLVAAAIMAHAPLQDAVVRVSYRGTEEQHRRVEVAALTGFLEEAGVHRVHGGLRWEPVRAARARVEGIDETVGVADAVGLWCDANEVPSARREELRALTNSYLQAGGS